MLHRCSGESVVEMLRELMGVRWSSRTYGMARAVISRGGCAVYIGLMGG